MLDQVVELGGAIRNYNSSLLCDEALLERPKLLKRKNFRNLIVPAVTVWKSAVKQDLFMDL